jgi:hypothetical protein
MPEPATLKALFVSILLIQAKTLKLHFRKLRRQSELNAGDVLWHTTLPSSDK